MDRRIFTSGQGLPSGCATKFDGYSCRHWGEFVECRFLAEFRHAGVQMLHMRPVFERLRDELEAPYPFASARLGSNPRGAKSWPACRMNWARARRIAFCRSHK